VQSPPDSGISRFLTRFREPYRQSRATVTDADSRGTPTSRASGPFQY
jgi:hypothetical protein